MRECRGAFRGSTDTYHDGFGRNHANLDGSSANMFEHLKKGERRTKWWFNEEERWGQRGAAAYLITSYP